MYMKDLYVLGRHILIDEKHMYIEIILKIKSLGIVKFRFFSFFLLLHVVPSDILINNWLKYFGLFRFLFYFIDKIL